MKVAAVADTRGPLGLTLEKTACYVGTPGFGVVGVLALLVYCADGAAIMSVNLPPLSRAEVSKLQPFVHFLANHPQ